MPNSQLLGVTIQLKLHYSQSMKPCELQKPIPNHQSSSCWIYLLLLTLSIIRSPCPHSHHCDSTSLVWILSHWSVFQGGLERGGIQSSSVGHWGRGRPIIGADIKHFYDYRYRPFSKHLARCSLSELNTLWEWGDLSISESNLRPPLIWYVESRVRPINAENWRQSHTESTC